MFQDKELADLMHSIVQKSLKLLTHLKENPAQLQATSQEVIALLEDQSKSFLHQLHQLLSDLETKSSLFNIKMPSANAFRIGEDLAQTPGKVILRNSLMELIQYTPQTPTVKSIPLLIIPPWINKYYILDLSPDNSLIQWLVAQGITVFMISWVNPDERFAHKTLSDYLEEGPRTAIAFIKKQMKVKKINTLGFCIGGTLLAILLAYNKAHKDRSIASATFLASLIDFSAPGAISIFIDEEQIKKLEEQMHDKGYFPGSLMNTSFNFLKANDLIWPFFIKNYLRESHSIPFDILFWNADSTNMPATMHSQYLRWMYLHNNLVKPGAICLNNTPIHVNSIDTPVFFLSTEKDHIAPWKTTYLGFQLMKGPKRFVLGGSGHIAGIINPPKSNKYHYKTNASTTSSAEEWLDNSVTHQGSWWPEWFSWLNSKSGPSIPATELKKLLILAIMDAPGTYVLEKSN